MAKKVAPPRPPSLPRVFWSLKGHSLRDAEDAIFLATTYGMEPDDWQKDIIRSWMARGRNGKWCHGRCGLAVPRQNGKNGAIEVRELFGMIVLGEAFLHTAHEVKTARKAFKRLQHFFGKKADDPDAKFPDLNALVAEVRNTNGQEAIVLHPFCEGCRTPRPEDSCDCENAKVRRGGSVEFVARSKGSGRGYTADVLVLDEAQHLDDVELEAIRSAVSSAPLGDPQVIYTGTPPDRDKGQTGVVFLRVRGGVEKKTRRLSWIEYGAPDGPLPDINSIDLLYACNPALDLRHANGAYGLQMDTIYDELEDLSPEGIARERFGWWGNPKNQSDLIDMAEWARMKDSTLPAPNRAGLVVDVEPDRAAATIGVGADGPGDRTLLLTQTKPGTAWVVGQIKKLLAVHDITELVLTPGQSAVIEPALKKAKIEYKVLTIKEMGAACGGFLAGVPDPLNPGGAAHWAHVGQPALDTAIKNAQTKMSGEVEVWDRKNPKLAISPIVAASTAGHRWRSSAPPKKTASPRRLGRSTTSSSQPTGAAGSRRGPRAGIASAGF